MNALIRSIDKVLSTFGKILVGTLASGVIISVFLRYVFSIAFVWSEEMLTMVFVATTFFGAALGMREKEHIGINYFAEKTSPRIQKILLFISYGIIAIVSGFVCVYSILLMIKVGSTPSPATGIPRGVYYTMIPITSALTLWYCFVGVLAQYRDIDDPEKEYMDDFDLLQETKREV